MKKFLYSITAVFCSFCIGLLFYALSQEWIIIRWPYTQEAGHTPTYQASTKKKILLSFWHHTTWRHEKVELIWPPEVDSQIRNIIHAWIHLLHEEHILKKHISLQSILMSDDGFVYISFDRNPLVKSQSTFINLMWLEGLIKTLREADVPIKGIYFMAHHQPLNDPHFDFSHPWPITGFTKL